VSTQTGLMEKRGEALSEGKGKTPSHEPTEGKRTVPDEKNPWKRTCIEKKSQKQRKKATATSIPAKLGPKGRRPPSHAREKGKRSLLIKKQALPPWKKKKK